jgi:hypothetical protein
MRRGVQLLSIQKTHLHLGFAEDVEVHLQKRLGLIDTLDLACKLAEGPALMSTISPIRYTERQILALTSGSQVRVLLGSKPFEVFVTWFCWKFIELASDQSLTPTKAAAFFAHSIETPRLNRQVTRLHFVINKIVNADSGELRVCEKNQQ